ncbi:hypothetical protein Cabther_B0378 [Chloracidobacterium thermophilum B]|uniref:Uncharacterized protein n=1 Tax=Chloracidobacterium thermophilum (strain B) TaxID=981222 RepID=G2LLA5_CHLTF|nr:hypothetical protein Cabther_B0378 [Chloracidobacterium thermophilum B]
MSAGSFAVEIFWGCEPWLIRFAPCPFLEPDEYRQPFAAAE